MNQTKSSHICPESPDQLLAQIAAGSVDALARLYEQVRGAVYGAALSYLKNGEDAQDVMQDVFVKIWDGAPAYEPRGSAMAWIMTITRNEALMALRSRSHGAQLEEEAWAAIPSASSGVTEDDKILLQQALGILSDQERKIVIFHGAAGLRHREVAQILNLPLSTVLSKYHRALKKMKDNMEGVV